MVDLDPNTRKMLDEQKANCIFCSISSGKVPSQKVFEDDKVFAILDINPASVGHVLVMTKEHYPILPLVPPGDLLGVCNSIKSIGGTFLKKLGVAGYTVFVANGAVAGQKAPHFILHLIPRKFEDGLNFSVKGKVVLNSDDASSLASSFAPFVSSVLNYSKGSSSVEGGSVGDVSNVDEGGDSSLGSDGSSDVDLDDISGLFGGS